MHTHGLAWLRLQVRLFDAGNCVALSVIVQGAQLRIFVSMVVASLLSHRLTMRNAGRFYLDTVEIAVVLCILLLSQVDYMFLVLMELLYFDRILAKILII